MIPGAQCDTIYIDNQNGAMQLTQFALGKGYKNMAFLIYDSHASITSSYIRGIRAAYEAHGLPLPEESIFTGTELDECASFIREKYASSRCPSMFVSFSSDFTAVCYRTLTSAKASMPGEVDLIGYDDLKMLEALGYHISLTPTTADMGTLAVHTLLNRMEHPDQKLPAQYISLPTQITVTSE